MLRFTSCSPQKTTWRSLAFICALLPVFCLAGCGTAGGQGEYRAAASPEIAVAKSYAPIWDGLAARLAKDGVSGPAVNRLLSQLGSAPTQSPMGRKISELYQKQFFPKPRSGKKTAVYYKGVVTASNAETCRRYIAENREAFDNAQKRFGVPPNIACALLFVETRLGKVLGDVPENAFYTLASMAICQQPDDISQWLPKLKDYQAHLDWIEETMKRRSNWAYKETLALVRHILKDDISPDRLPGSIYGAVGLCQFMPSNISAYGADGNGDGKVDLFNIPDAIASLANYLAKHGWQAGIGRERQRRLLMTYNHSTVYANTILALADLIAKSVKPGART